MKRINIIIVLALFSSLVVSAQTSLREGRIISVQSSKPKAKSHVSVNISHTTSNTKGVKNGNKVISNDTIYCRRTKKQHGWFAPMDTITKDITCHLGYSFRLTKKNVAGHWLRMECLDSYGNYVKGSLSPYILKLGSAAESDKNANSDWVEKLKTACIWEFIADYTGETIVQERAYDENMNIIYTFSRVPIGNGQYNCSYKDNYGLPAEMRNDEEYTYGTLVRITEDRWGNDSVIQYIDAKGLPKLNSDSVAMEVYICDKYGHILKQQSRNMDGSLAIDNWGNCGVEYEWNNKHNIESATYMNDHWRPMRMPALRDVNGKENIITSNYRYDKYGNQLEEFYTDSLGQMDVNALGTHKIVSEFDERGNLIKQEGFDINDNRSPIDNSGIAYIRQEFNDRGQILSCTFLDKQLRPNSTVGYLSKVIEKYDSDGSKILDEQYSAESGTEKLTYQKKTAKNYIYTQWNNGSFRIDSLDSKGRTTFVGFYDSNRNLELNDGRAYECYTYLDEIGKCTEMEIDYDTLGNKVDIDGICKTITVSDSIKWTKTKWRYDKNDLLVETFIHQYNKGFNRIVSQDDANTFGIKSRSGGSSSVRYYTGEIVYSQKGEFASLLGRDEFGEPDYITSNSTTYYYSKRFAKSKTKYYDEDNNEIKNEEELRDNLPKVMTIEVVDSSAYVKGLRDNDVILLFGNYAVDVNALDSVFVSYEQFRKDWSLRSILDASMNKRMVVFRIEDASNNKYGLVEIKNLKGTPSELGFLPHIRYLTKKQLARIQHSVKDNMQCNNPLISNSDFNRVYEGDNYVIVAYREMYRSVRNGAYPKYVTDPAILLGACIKDRNMYWNLTDAENTESFEEMLDSRGKKAAKYPTMHYFVTKDMNTTIDMTLDDQYVYANWFDAYISDKDYAKLLDIYKQVKYSMDAIRKKPSTIKSKNLYGFWEIRNTAMQPYLPEGQMFLAKDGKCQGTLVTYGTITFSEGKAVYKVEKDIDGTWNHNDSLIFFKPYLGDSIRLSCVDLLGTDDDDLKHRTIAFMNSRCDDNKEYYLKRMDFEYPQWNNDLFINSLEKKCLTIKGNEDIAISFEKTKTIPSLRTHQMPTNKRKGAKSIINQENVNPLLLGEWEMDIPDMDGGKATMSFKDDHTMELGIQALWSEALNDSITAKCLFFVTIGGDWSDKGDSISIVNNPALTKIDVDIDFDGVDEETKNALRPLFANEIEEQKEEMAMQLLKGTSFEGAFSIDTLTDTELSLNGVTLSRVPQKHQIVIGRIEGDKGYLVEQGYTGLYVVLEWCDWDCTQTIDDYSKEFEKQKDFNKHIVLLPVGTDENGNDQFKDIISIDCPSTRLGLRISDSEISELYYQNQIYKRYIDWKSEMQSRVGNRMKK